MDCICVCTAPHMDLMHAASNRLNHEVNSSLSSSVSSRLFHAISFDSVSSVLSTASEAVNDGDE